MKYLVLFLLILSCSSDKPKGKTEAEKLFNEAKEMMESERYILATEKLNQIKTQHPYSFYATPAELMQADILYLQENFIEAAAAYLLFRDFHPKHERIPYVVFRIAESYYKQIPDTIDRDLEPAMEAIRYYDEVIQKYPDSSYKADAEAKINKAAGMLRSKDQYIADFYFKTHEYKAAIYWYLDMLENHSDEKTQKHSMYRIIVATSRLREWQSCLDYIDKFYDSVDKKVKKEIKSIKAVCAKEL